MPTHKGQIEKLVFSFSYNTMICVVGDLAYQLGNLLETWDNGHEWDSIGISDSILALDRVLDRLVSEYEIQRVIASLWQDQQVGVKFTREIAGLASSAGLHTPGLDAFHRSYNDPATWLPFDDSPEVAVEVATDA